MKNTIYTNIQINKKGILQGICSCGQHNNLRILCFFLRADECLIISWYRSIGTAQRYHGHNLLDRIVKFYAYLSYRHDQHSRHWLLLRHWPNGS